MSKLTPLVLCLAFAACATGSSDRDRNAAPVDPCDCGDEQTWDAPPPKPGTYTPENGDDPRDNEGGEPHREDAN